MPENLYVFILEQRQKAFQTKQIVLLTARRYTAVWNYFQQTFILYMHTAIPTSTDRGSSSGSKVECGVFKAKPVGQDGRESHKQDNLFHSQCPILLSLNCLRRDFPSNQQEVEENDWVLSWLDVVSKKYWKALNFSWLQRPSCHLLHVETQLFILIWVFPHRINTSAH